MLYQDLIENKLSQYGYNYEVRKGSIIIHLQDEDLIIRESRKLDNHVTLSNGNDLNANFNKEGLKGSDLTLVIQYHEKQKREIETYADIIKRPTELVINLKSGKVIKVNKNDVYSLENEINKFKHAFKSDRNNTFLIEFKEHDSTVDLEFLLSQVEGYSIHYKEGVN